MRRVSTLAVAAVTGLVVVCGLAFAAQPAPDQTLHGKTHTYNVYLVVSKSGDKVTANVSTIYTSCPSGLARGGAKPVKIKDSGKFTAVRDDPVADLKVTGKFVSKHKAEGTVRLNNAGSTTCPTEEYTAKTVSG